MGAYMDGLRLAGLGLVVCGGISYGLIVLGLAPVFATVACLGIFFVWAVSALHISTIPGHRLAVGLGTAYYPPAFNSTIRHLVRTGTREELRAAGQPVATASRLVEQTTRRNIPFSAVVAGIILIDGRWVLAHKVAAGTSWALAIMALGLVDQLLMQLWFVWRCRYVQSVCGHSSMPPHM